MKKMFVLAEDRKQGLASTPIIWFKKNANETGYYWPIYGLSFKLKNYSPLPTDPQQLKNEWRYVHCTILLEGKKFKTYQDAEKALSDLLKVEKGKRNIVKPFKEANEVQSIETAEVQSIEKAAADVQLVEKESAEVQSIEKGAADVQLVEKESAEVQSIEKGAADVQLVEKEAAEVQSVEEKAAEVQSVEGKAAEEQLVEKEAAQVQSVEKELNEVAEAVSVDLEDKEATENSDGDENLPFDNIPSFSNNVELLKNKSGFNKLAKFYDNINESSERKYFNVCVKKTFTDRFLLKDITFKKDANREDWIGVFDETRLYECLKKAVVKKLELNGLNDSVMKQIFITNFERIKRAIRARK